MLSDSVSEDTDNLVLSDEASNEVGESETDSSSGGSSEEGDDRCENAELMKNLTEQLENEKIRNIEYQLEIEQLRVNLACTPQKEQRPLPIRRRRQLTSIVLPKDPNVVFENFTRPAQERMSGIHRELHDITDSLKKITQTCAYSLESVNASLTPDDFQLSSWLEPKTMHREAMRRSEGLRQHQQQVQEEIFQITAELDTKTTDKALVEKRCPRISEKKMKIDQLKASIKLLFSELDDKLSTHTETYSKSELASERAIRMEGDFGRIKALDDKLLSTHKAAIRMHIPCGDPPNVWVKLLNGDNTFKAPSEMPFPNRVNNSEGAAAVGVLSKKLGRINISLTPSIVIRPSEGVVSHGPSAGENIPILVPYEKQVKIPKPQQTSTPLVTTPTDDKKISIRLKEHLTDLQVSEACFPILELNGVYDLDVFNMLTKKELSTCGLSIGEVNKIIIKRQKKIFNPILSSPGPGYVRSPGNTPLPPVHNSVATPAPGKGPLFRHITSKKPSEQPSTPAAEVQATPASGTFRSPWRAPGRVSGGGEVEGSNLNGMQKLLTAASEAGMSEKNVEELVSSQSSIDKFDIDPSKAPAILKELTDLKDAMTPMKKLPTQSDNPPPTKPIEPITTEAKEEVKQEPKPFTMTALPTEEADKKPAAGLMPSSFTPAPTVPQPKKTISLSISKNQNESGSGIAEKDLIVTKLKDNGPAARAGMKIGMKIVKVAGIEVTDSTNYTAAIRAAGNAFVVEVEDDKAPVAPTMMSTLTESKSAPPAMSIGDSFVVPSFTSAAASSSSFSSSSATAFPASTSFPAVPAPTPAPAPALATPTPALAPAAKKTIALSITKNPGEAGSGIAEKDLIITKLKAGGPASRAGMQIGMKIVKVAGIAVRDSAHYTETIRGAGSTFQVEVEDESAVSATAPAPVGAMPAIFGALSGPSGNTSLNAFPSGTTATSAAAFGTSSSAAFGTSSSAAFGTSSSAAFGISSSAAFGTSSSAAFGISSSAAFGTSTAATPAAGVFGVTGGGQTGGFGQAPTAAGGLAQPAAGTTGQTGLGLMAGQPQQPTTQFGQPQQQQQGATPFGQQQQQPQQQQGTTPSGQQPQGAAPFGQQQPQQQQQGATPFGQPQQQTGTFAQPGQQQQQTPFGQPQQQAGTFAQPGQQQQQQQQQTPFGQRPNPFGQQPPQQQQQQTPFGQPPQQQQQTPFGQQQQPGNTNPFGQTGFGQQQTTPGFGQQPQQSQQFGNLGQQQQPFNNSQQSTLAPGQPGTLNIMRQHTSEKIGMVCYFVYCN